ncbi:putative DNA binding domain-containing protein [candidate division KSB1 bacterium]|nr:putative DNA binding domain-containing protein [candidate division KSB1 bacterium]
MFDTVQEIIDQLKLGEDSFVEFKEVKFRGEDAVELNPESFAGEICAFANTAGGVMLVGIHDDGIVQGIPQEKLSLVENYISNVCRNNCRPPVLSLIKILMLPDSNGVNQPVVKIDVPKSIFVHQTSGGRYFQRLGVTKVDLTPQELARLFQQREQSFIFDEQIIRQASFDHLNQKLLKSFAPEARHLPWEKILENKRIVSRDEQNTLRPSVAGLLVFGDLPEQFLYSAYIEAAAYRGVEMTSAALIDAQKITGPLHQQIDDAVNFVERNMKVASIKTVGRQDFPQYDILAVHEAVVNAAAHRDYSNGGDSIRVLLFDDRLEIYNPGRLPNTITLENLADRQYTRNQLLVSFLSRLISPYTGRHYIEARGEGIRLILERSTAVSGKQPQYQLLGDELLLMLWAAPPPFADNTDQIKKQESAT